MKSGLGDRGKMVRKGQCSGMLFQGLKRNNLEKEEGKIFANKAHAQVSGLGQEESPTPWLR